MESPEHQVEYLALRMREDSGVLGEKPHSRFEQLRQTISEKWPAASQPDRTRLASAGACLDRLAGFCLQVKRITDHMQQLRERMIPAVPESPQLMPGVSAAFRASGACTDFEALLFHGRAMLDRLTLFIAKEHLQKTDNFPRLANVLANFNHNDRRAAVMLDVLSRADRLSGVLKDIDGLRSLRSRVTHRTSISEGTRNAFTAHRLADGRLLLFDCESLGYPVLGTSHSLAGEVPFVVLNALSLYLEVEGSMAIADFDPPWSNPSVSYREYIDASGDGPLFSVYRMEPDGFTAETQHLKPEVLDHALPLD